MNLPHSPHHVNSDQGRVALLTNIFFRRPPVTKVNWSRKIWHLVGGLTAITLPLLFGWAWALIAALATLLPWITIESLRRHEPWFGKLFFTISEPFVRHRERRKMVGNTWLAFSVTILAVIFRDPILLAGSMVGWTFGDPAAEIFGKLIPSKRYFEGEKSIAGTLACFFVSFLAYYLFFRIIQTGGDIVAASLTVATAVTMAETFSLSFTVNDNFTIPLASALALSYILI